MGGTTSTQPTSKLGIILVASLIYSYIRVAYELFANQATSTSLYYLIGIIIGVHGLQLWLSRARTSDHSGLATAQIVLVTIVVIALLMDAGRMLIVK